MKELCRGRKGERCLITGIQELGKTCVLYEMYSLIYLFFWQGRWIGMEVLICVQGLRSVWILSLLTCEGRCVTYSQ